MTLFFSRGGDGFADLVRTALIVAVGQDDHGLAAGLLIHLLVRGHVDGVVEQGAFGCPVDGHRAAADAGNSAGAIAARGVDLGLVHGTGQQARAVGVVLQQIDVHIEGDQEGLVFLAQHLLQEAAARLLLQRQNALLAARCVEQDSQGECLVRLGHKVLQSLGHLVFGDGAVVLGQVRNEVAVLVLHGEEEVDEVDLDLEGGDRLVFGRRVGRVAHRRSIGRRRKLRTTLTRRRPAESEEARQPRWKSASDEIDGE